MWRTKKKEEKMGNVSCQNLMPSPLNSTRSLQPLNIALPKNCAVALYQGLLRRNMNLLSKLTMKIYNDFAFVEVNKATGLVQIP